MKKKEIVAAIDMLKPALANGNLLEYAGLIIMDGQYMSAYGDEIFTSVPFKSPFSAPVPYQEFLKLIQKLGENVDITVEGDQLIVKSGKTTSGFNIVKFTAEPPDWNFNVDGWKVLPDDFASALKFCAFSASTNAASGVLQNVLVDGDRALSCDNYRITEFGLSGPAPKLMIPRQIASFLSKYNVKEVLVTPTVVHYSDGGDVIFTHRTIADDYPDVDAFFDVEGVEIEFPEGVEKALDVSGVLATENSTGGLAVVKIKISKGKIEVRGEGPKGWIEGVVDTDYNGTPMTFMASPQHLIQILERSRKVIIGENTLMFLGDGFRHVVCLISE